MTLPKWTRSKVVRWIALIVLVLVVHTLSHVALNQWRGRSIAKKAGLPQLPSRAWVTYAHTEDHNLLFEEVSMGFTAPRAQMDEWLKGVDDWKPNESASEANVLNHSIRRWGVTSGVDFSATLNYK